VSRVDVMAILADHHMRLLSVASQCRAEMAGPMRASAEQIERARAAVEELVLAAREMLADDDGGMAAPRLRSALEAIGAEPRPRAEGER
jgi:hypothetical protein